MYAFPEFGTSSGLAGAQVARALLDARGLQSVRIELTPGMLSDHYDPQSKTLRLSPEVYYTPSLAAAGIAAHETGHALQDAAGYLPLKARSLIVPAVQLSAKVAPWLFIAGVLLGANTLAWAGVLLFGAQTLFTLITLPVEFDASTRAQQLLVSQGIIRGEQQVEGIEKVLGAAAWTYVAGAVSSAGSFFMLPISSTRWSAAMAKALPASSPRVYAAEGVSAGHGRRDALRRERFEHTFPISVWRATWLAVGGPKLAGGAAGVEAGRLRIAMRFQTARIITRPCRVRCRPPPLRWPYRRRSPRGTCW